jgi:hypothetical protein
MKRFLGVDDPPVMTGMAISEQLDQCSEYLEHGPIDPNSQYSGPDFAGAVS